MRFPNVNFNFDLKKFIISALNSFTPQIIFFLMKSKDMRSKSLRVECFWAKVARNSQRWINFLMISLMKLQFIRSDEVFIANHALKLSMSRHMRFQFFFRAHRFMANLTLHTNLMNLSLVRLQ